MVGKGISKAKEGGRYTFVADVARIVRKVKSTKKLPGVTKIYVHGERGGHPTSDRLARGELEI